MAERGLDLCLYEFVALLLEYKQLYWIPTRCFKKKLKKKTAFFARHHSALAVKEASFD